MSLCLLVKDFQYIFKEQRKYLLIYLFIMLSFSLYYLFIISMDPIKGYINALGLNFNFNQNILIMIMFFIHFFVAIYVQIYLLVNDIRFGFSNLLLRVNLKKWFIARFISTSVVIITIRTILHVLFIIISIFLKGSIMLNEIINYWFIDCIYFILIQKIGLLFYLLFYLSKKMIIVEFFLVIAFLSYIPLHIFDYSLYLLLVILVLQFINYFILKRVYVKIFEEEI